MGTSTNTQRTRDDKSATRSRDVLAFCSEPRTMAEIMAHFGGALRYQFTTHNLARSGHLVNLNGGAGRSRLGTYLAVKANPKMSSVRRDDPSDAGPIFTEAGKELASVWGART